MSEFLFCILIFYIPMSLFVLNLKFKTGVGRCGEGCNRGDVVHVFLNIMILFTSSLCAFPYLSCYVSVMLILQ